MLLLVILWLPVVSLLLTYWLAVTGVTVTGKWKQNELLYLLVSRVSNNINTGNLFTVYFLWHHVEALIQNPPKSNISKVKDMVYDFKT